MRYGRGAEMQFRDALTLEKVARAGSAFARAPLDAPLGWVAQSRSWHLMCAGKSIAGRAR